ncbi:MAG: RNA methyltransferase [Bacteroidota bacterium]
MKKLSMDELNRLSAEEFQAAPKIPVVVVLDNIRSCHNIGSVFRTSDAMRVSRICLCGITATPPNKEIHKAALDAEKSVDWVYEKDTAAMVSRLKEEGFRVYAVEQVEGSIMLPDFTPSGEEKLALVFGNEVNGVQQEVVNLCDGAIEIPQFGTKHSFNVAVSAGIVLWEVSRKYAL